MTDALYLEDVLELVKSFDIAEHVYIGKLDAKQDKSIGVYNYKRSVPYNRPLGGDKARTHDIKYVSFLVHWNRSVRETEKAALGLLEALEATRETKVNDKTIKFIIPLMDAPIEVGTDSNGIFESVIEATIYYERIGE